MPNAFEIGMCCQSGDKKGKKPNWFIYWLFGMMMVKNCVCFIFSYFLCLYLHLRGLLQEICRLVDRKIFLYDAREFVYCPIQYQYQNWYSKTLLCNTNIGNNTSDSALAIPISISVMRIKFLQYQYP